MPPFKMLHSVVREIERGREKEREGKKERNLLLCPRVREPPSEQYAVAARNEKVDTSAVG